MVSVSVDEPRGKAYGGLIAAPVFARVAGQSLSHLNILPRDFGESFQVAQAELEPLPDLAPLLPVADAPDRQDGLLMPDFRGMSFRQVLRAMEQQKLNLKLSGSGQVIEQSPAPGQRIRYGKQAWVRFGA